MMFQFIVIVELHWAKSRFGRAAIAAAVNSPFDHTVVEEGVKTTLHAVELQDYIDTLLLTAPPVVYFGYKVLIDSTRVSTLLLESGVSRTVRGARLWFALGTLVYALKRLNVSSRVRRRVELGEDRKRAELYELLETPYFGWFMPLFASLLNLVARRRSSLPAGLVYHTPPPGAGHSWPVRLIARSMALLGKPLVQPLWIGAATWLSFSAVETASILGMRRSRGAISAPNCRAIARRSCLRRSWSFCARAKVARAKACSNGSKRGVNFVYLFVFVCFLFLFCFYFENDLIYLFVCVCVSVFLFLFLFSK